MRSEERTHGAATLSGAVIPAVRAQCKSERDTMQFFYPPVALVYRPFLTSRFRLARANHSALVAEDGLFIIIQTIYFTLCYPGDAIREIGGRRLGRAVNSGASFANR